MTVAEQQTTEQSHHSRRELPVASNSIPTMPLSIFDPGNRPIPWLLGPLFQIAPAILSSALPIANELVHELLRPSPVNEGYECGRTDNGKGKGRAVDPDIEKPVPEPQQTEDEAFADTLRESITASRKSGSRVRSPSEAGPSGSSSSTLTLDIASSSTTSASTSQARHFFSEAERAEIDHAILLSSIEHVENAFHTLRTNFTFPTRLDHHLPPNPNLLAFDPIDEDNTGSIATYLPTTSRNSVVFDFVRQLRGLLEQLGHLDSKRDAEAESMKGKVAAAINEILDEIESKVEEAIAKWMSLQVAEIDVMEG